MDLRRDHLVSLNEWDAMPEDMCRRHELVDGVLNLIASPVPLHQRAARHLANWLDGQLPEDLVAECDVDVVLQPGARATVCRPDVVVVSAESYGDGRHRLEAADVLLAVEVVSPGSKRADRVTKPMRYAKAGIGRYWIVDLDEPTSLAAFELVDDLYKPTDEGVGTVQLTWPEETSIDLNRLTRRR